MKKTLIVSVMALAVAFNTYAQLGKGSVLLGGGIAATTATAEMDGDETGKESELAFDAGLGFFVSDGLAIGLTVSHATANSMEEDPDFGDYEIDTRATGIGVFLRSYKFLGNDNFAVFAQGSLSFLRTSQKMEFDGNSGEIDGNGIDIAVSPGLTYFLNERWSAELLFRGIAYTSLTPDKDQDEYKLKTVTIGLNSLSPTLAVRVYFAK